MERKELTRELAAIKALVPSNGMMTCPVIFSNNALLQDVNVRFTVIDALVELAESCFPAENDAKMIVAVNPNAAAWGALVAMRYWHELPFVYGTKFDGVKSGASIVVIDSFLLSGKSCLSNVNVLKKRGFNVKVVAISATSQAERLFAVEGVPLKVVLREKDVLSL